MMMVRTEGPVMAVTAIGTIAISSPARTTKGATVVGIDLLRALRQSSSAMSSSAPASGST